MRPLAERVPVVPDQVEQAVRLNGAVQVVAGSLLAIGRFPRLSAAALAASLIPTTYAGHRFWESDDKQERSQQKIHFLKNLSMLGGLLIAAGDTAGNPSVAWRSRHAANDGQAGGGADRQERAGRLGQGRSSGGQGRGQDVGQGSQGGGQGRRQGR